MNTTFLNPARIVEVLSVEEGMKVAEFGSGTGMFSLELAKKVGRDGKVYAVDVQKETLSALKSRCRLEGIFNVETVWADLEKTGSTGIPEASLDITLLPNMLFQSEKKEDILREAHRITKTGGSVVVIDWHPEKAIYGKAMGWPVVPDEMRSIAEKAGMVFVAPIETSSVYHYGLLFKKG